MVTAADIDRFRVDGAVVIRGAIEVTWVDRLRLALEQNLTDPGPWACTYTPEDGPGGFRDDYCNWDRFDDYEAFVRTSPAAALVGALMQTDRVRFFHEHVLVKEPGTRERTPWHHDQPYYPVDGDQVCSMWLPLDPVPQGTCPRFVAGSHRWPGYLAPKTFVDQERYVGADGLEPVPDIDADPLRYPQLSWELDLGDCIVFHMKTVHGAPGTAGQDGRRRAFSTRWLGDDAIWAERPYPTSPPFPDVDLGPGDPLTHWRFPEVR